MTTPGTDHKEPRAVEVLIAEHVAGRVYLDQMEALHTPAVDQQKEVDAVLELVADALVYFEDDLEEHIAKEEEAFFPRFEGRLRGANSALIDEFLAEHDQIRIHRDDLAAVLGDLLSGHDDMREDRASVRAALDRCMTASDENNLKALVDEVRRIAMIAIVHFDNEEELLFPLATTLLQQDELDAAAVEIDAIGERFAAARGAASN